MDVVLYIGRKIIVNDMRYFRQAFALIREEKLYSAMYIAGTALAVAFVMLIAEVFYVKGGRHRAGTFLLNPHISINNKLTIENRTMETVIKLTGINKVYRTDEVETQALENVNLEVKKGEFLSIMGPSGCGKSTLLNIMGLLDEPTSGEIELCGTKIDPKLSDNRLAELRNKTLGFVFQSFHLLSLIHI